MNLEVLDMPEEPTQLAGWLEQRLAGPDLPTLADDLSAFREAPAGTAPAVRRAAGRMAGAGTGGWAEAGAAGSGAAAAVLAGAAARIARVGVHARRALTGTGCWGRTAASKTPSNTADSGSRPPFPPRARPERQAAPTPVVLPLRKKPSGRRTGWVLGLAAAAAVVVLAVGISRYFPPSAPPAKPAALASHAWGWNRPGVLDSDGPPDAYLNRLADAAEEWSAEKPGGGGGHGEAAQRVPARLHGAVVRRAPPLVAGGSPMAHGQVPEVGREGRSRIGGGRGRRRGQGARRSRRNDAAARDRAAEKGPETGRRITAGSEDYSRKDARGR